MKEKISNQNFLKEFLSSSELEQFHLAPNKIQYAASRFAAKEAVYKALKGQLIKYIYSDHFSVLRQSGSFPIIYISPEFQLALNNIYQKNTIQVSISHEEEYSVAVALLA